jgi:transcriptional regulator with XRE-family HTH domain
MKPLVHESWMGLEPRVELVGRTVASLREVLGWTQQELAQRAHMSQATVSAIENGRVSNLTFSRAERLLAAMGARLVVSVDAPSLGDRQRQREPAHARCSAHVASRLRRAGWQVATEVEVGGDRSRGWIDVLAYHPATGWLLVVEIKTEIRDLGGIERSLGWYEREAGFAAPRTWLASQAVDRLPAPVGHGSERHSGECQTGTRSRRSFRRAPGISATSSTLAASRHLRAVQSP